MEWDERKRKQFIFDRRARQPGPRIPDNPAQLQPGGLLFNLAMGVAFILSLFFLLGIYLWAKGKGH